MVCIEDLRISIFSHSSMNCLTVISIAFLTDLSIDLGQNVVVCFLGLGDMGILVVEYGLNCHGGVTGMNFVGISLIFWCGCGKV